MPTSILLAPRPDEPSVTPMIGTCVWMLRTWNSNGENLALYFSYDTALHALASSVHVDWHEHSWLPGLPDTPGGLTDGQAVSLFYGGEIQLSPSHGELYNDGFDIVEHRVYGPEPEQLNLRMASLRVVDESLRSPQGTPLTYRVEALGLAIAAFAGSHGPIVQISNDSLPAGTALTVIAEDFERCA